MQQFSFLFLHLIVSNVCMCAGGWVAVVVNSGLIKGSGFIWSEQCVQDPLQIYVSNRDLSSDTEHGGVPVKSNNLLYAEFIRFSQSLKFIHIILINLCSKRRHQHQQLKQMIAERTVI